MTTFLCG